MAFGRKWFRPSFDSVFVNLTCALLEKSKLLGTERSDFQTQRNPKELGSMRFLRRSRLPLIQKEPATSHMGNVLLLHL
jgi:hypothetical protein